MNNKLWMIAVNNLDLALVGLIIALIAIYEVT